MRADIRACASAPHGIPAADRYPGTCRKLTKIERAKREAAGRPPALRVRGGTPGSRSRTACSGTPRGRRTTSWCAGTTAPPPTNSRWWLTTPRRASGKSCGAPTSWARRYVISCSIVWPALGSPATPTRPPRARPGRQTPRHTPRRRHARRPRRRGRRTQGDPVLDGPFARPGRTRRDAGRRRPSRPLGPRKVASGADRLVARSLNALW